MPAAGCEPAPQFAANLGDGTPSAWQAVLVVVEDLVSGTAVEHGQTGAVLGDVLEFIGESPVFRLLGFTISKGHCWRVLVSYIIVWRVRNLLCWRASGSPDMKEAAGSQHPPYFVDLYDKSKGAEVGLSFAEFAAALREISGRYLPAGASDSDAAELHRTLRLEELALARACVAGQETAWERFIVRYRPRLYQIAAAITHDEAAARELADSLYADLYSSKLRFYTGRGSLEGWLRTVAAQEYIDRYRRARRLVSFDEAIATEPPSAAPDPAPADDRLERALDATLAELSGEERFILASWYLDGRTLAQIGRMLGVHESTVSRRVEKIVAGVRKRIVKRLKEAGVSGREAEEMMKADVRDLGVDIRGRLVQEKRG